MRARDFFEKAFDTSRGLPYIAARRRRIRVRADVGPPRFSGELFKLSFLPKGGGGAVRTSSEGKSDEIEHDGDSRGACVAGDVVGFRGFGLDRYLTISSEGRETWAAGSLRGFVVWVCLARAERVQAMGSEETTDGHVSKFIALLR